MLQASIGDVRFRKLCVAGVQNRVAAAVLRIRQVRRGEDCREFGAGMHARAYRVVAERYKYRRNHLTRGR